MYKLIVNIILLGLFQQVFASEEPSNKNCQISLISSSKKFISRDKRKKGEASNIAKIQSKGDKFLHTIDSLHLDTDTLLRLWRAHIYYILDLVHHTPEQLLDIGIDRDSVHNIKLQLLEKGLSLRMLFHHSYIQNNIDIFNKKQKAFYDIFRYNVSRISLNLNRDEFINRLKSEVNTLKQRFLYRPIEKEGYYHREGVFGEIEWNLVEHSQKLPYFNEGLRKWVLEEMQEIMKEQGIRSHQYDI